MAITDRRIQSSKQRAIRAIMAKVVADGAAKQSVGEFVKSVISGELAKAIAIGCKPIHPVSRVEVRKSEVYAIGEIPAAPTAAPALETPAEIPAEAPVEAPAAEQPEPEEPAPEELPPEELKHEDFDEL
jgi:ribosomal protein S3AE